MNRILFLYTTPYRKQELERCEEVFRAIMRKFRKSVSFIYVHADTSESCRCSLKNLLEEKQSISDGIIWNADGAAAETDMAKDVFGTFAACRAISGRYICFPLCSKSFTCKDGKLLQNTEYLCKDTQKALEIALTLAKSHKQDLKVCTAADDALSLAICREYELALEKESHINIKFNSFDEFVWHSMHSIPFADVLLTTQECAQIISMHLRSLQRVPAGYTVWHGEKLRIYKRDIFPFEGVSNSCAASLMLSFAGLLKNELHLDGACLHLCRSVAAALEKCGAAPESEFIREVILEIQKPIRKRKAKQHESANQ